MKKIHVKTNDVALVFKKGELKRVLTAGSHWIGFREELQVYDMSKPFSTTVNNDLLLQHPDFSALMQVVTVGDNELALVYEGKNFKTVLTPGKHLFWKGITDDTYRLVNTAAYDIPADIDRNLLDRQPLAQYVRAARVEAHEQALLLIDGRYIAIAQPGNYFWWKNSTVIQLQKTDMRQLAMDITGQEILTRDKAQLRINFTVQYKVADIVKALSGSKDFEKQLYIIMQLALREAVGRLSFDELMDARDALSEQILATTMAGAAALGVHLVSCGLKDIILPGEIKDIMNQVLVAEKRAQANTITRREETASTRSLLNTAKLMEDNAMLLKLKEMEYVEKIAEKISSISVSGNGQLIDQLKQIFVKA